MVMNVSRKHKIKRSEHRKSTYKARRHPLYALLLVVLIVGLVGLGMIIYQPIHDAIMSWVTREPPPPPTLPEPDPNGEVIEQPEPEPVRWVPDELRAIYAPPELVGNASAFNAFLDSLPAAGLNAVMIDIKDRGGQLLHTSQNANAIAWNAIDPYAFDLSELSGRLEERGLVLIARMPAFRSRLAALGNPDYAVRFGEAEGMMWLDNEPGIGVPWLNPHSQGARQYITDLAVEAAEMGAVMVVLDYFQFPPHSLMEWAFFRYADGVSRTDRLRQFADELNTTFEGLDARLAIHMQSIALASEPNMTFYGGPAQDILSEYTLLSALPYQFFTWFSHGDFVLHHPLEDLDYTLTKIVTHAQQVTDSHLIVLLQGGSLPDGAQYTDEEIRAQVERLSGLGVREFVFFAPDAGQYQIAEIG